MFGVVFHSLLGPSHSKPTIPRCVQSFLRRDELALARQIFYCYEIQIRDFELTEIGDKRRVFQQVMIHFHQDRF